MYSEKGRIEAGKNAMAVKTDKYQRIAKEEKAINFRKCYYKLKIISRNRLAFSFM